MCVGASLYVLDAIFAEIKKEEEIYLLTVSSIFICHRPILPSNRKILKLNVVG